MRKLLFTLLFAASCLLGFAQKIFTEQTFMDISKRYQKDAVQFFKTEASPDFMLVGSDGNVFNLQGTIGLFDKLNVADWSASDVKIRQFGTTAIVTGLLSHKAVSR